MINDSKNTQKHLAGFNSPDASNNIDQLIDYLYQYHSMPMIAKYKQISYDLLDLKVGSKVLDVGCGLGFDLINFLSLVSSTGHVFGVDVSEHFLAYAKKKIPQRNITLIRHDMRDDSLPLPLSSVDACYTDRVLIHMKNPLDALQKMRQMIRLDGTIVVTEPDWSQFTMDCSYPEIASRVIYAFANYSTKTIINPKMGGSLAGFLKQAGFIHIEVQAVPVPVTQMADANKVIPIQVLLGHAVTSGQISENESALLLNDLISRDARNAFFACHSMLIAKGLNPG